MTRRPCLDCGTPGPASRCPTCTLALGRQRPNRQARGYGAEHERARRQLIAQLPTACHGCGMALLTPQTMVAGHRVDGRPEYGYVAVCRGCNERMKHRPQTTPQGRGTR